VPEREDSDTDFSDGDSDDGLGDEMDPNSVQHRYRDSTWGNFTHTYDPPRNDFIGYGGPKRRWRRFPSFMTLFQMFWSMAMLVDIVEETDRYATTVDGEGRTSGGPNWKDFSVPELKVFLPSLFTWV
jgi:hypothetical protein